LRLFHTHPEQRPVSVLQMKSISVQFQGLKALDRVDLTLSRGEILGLLGPNGAGKTTLINVMTGFVRPSEGQMLLGGEVVSGLTPEALARRGVARTFQSVRLFRRLSVLENVEIAALTLHRRRARARHAARQALAFTGLEQFAHRRAGALAYADERRVGIARALALEPQFLLLDEPAAGMTEAECETLSNLITQLPQRFSCGVLLIEHNVSVVIAVCREIHVLDNGRTLASGAINIVRRDPAVIAAYLGTA
jgi:branched-chain amino acid transport system ATP-binding protein